MIIRASDGIARTTKKGSTLERLVRFRVVGSEKDAHQGSLWVTVLFNVKEVRNIDIFEAFTLKHKLVCWMLRDVVCGSSTVKYSGCSVCSLFAR